MLCIAELVTSMPKQEWYQLLLRAKRTCRYAVDKVAKTASAVMEEYCTEDTEAYSINTRGDCKAQIVLSVVRSTGYATHKDVHFVQHAETTHTLHLTKMYKPK